MHYIEDDRVAELIANGNFSALDPESGEPIGTSRMPSGPRRMTLDDIAPYKMRTTYGEKIEHAYVYDPQKGTWEETVYGALHPLTLTMRDFAKNPARADDTLAAAQVPDEEEEEDGSALAGITLQQLLGESRYRDLIIDEIVRQYPPQYGPQEKERLARSFADAMRSFHRTPMAGQADAILACALSIERRRGTTLVGEMGCGKTTMSIMTARLAGMKLIATVCPVHLTRKWRREVLQTIPKASAYIIENIRPERGARSTPIHMDLETFRRIVERRKANGTLTADRPIYAIFPSTLASLSHAGEGVDRRRSIFRNPSRTYPIAALDHDGSGIVRSQPRLETIKKKVVQEVGRQVIETYVPTTAQVCPDCFSPVLDEEDIPYESSRTFYKSRLKCGVCGGALWSARSLSRNREMDVADAVREEHAARAHKPVHKWTGPREQAWHGKNRFALGEFVSKKMRKFFDLMIADEVHEYKGEGSARGIVVGNMSRASKKTLTLTGTLMGGYSSNLFYIMQRFGDELRGEFSYGDAKRWTQRYGFEQTIKKKEEETSYNSQSRGFRSTSTREKPGLSPLALPLILGNTAFIRLQDVTDDLPPYTETVRLVKLDDVDQGGTSHAKAYEDLSDEFTAAVRKSLQAGSHRMLGAYLHALLAYPDNPVVEEAAYDDEGDLIAYAPALDPNVSYPKEKELLRIAKEQRARGKPTMVLINYTNRRDIAPRLKETLERAGLRVQILRSSVEAKEREARIERWVREGVDVVISHPNLIQTGLDLIDFPTIVWYQPTYSTYTLRQASRRSWRIGQDSPVEIIHLIYAGTMQERALELIAKKAQTSLAVEGELPEEGLAAYGDDTDSIHLALAKSLVSSENARGEMIEETLAEGSRKQELDAGYLVSEAWLSISSYRPPEPEVAEEPAMELTANDIAIFSEIDGDMGTEEKPSLFGALLN